MQEEVVEPASSKAGPGRPDGGPRSWSAAPGGGAQFASVNVSGSVMLAGADVDVVDVDGVDVGPRRRSISSLTVDAMRAESFWVSVTCACPAEGGVDGGPSLDLDPHVARSVLFPPAGRAQSAPAACRRHVVATSNDDVGQTNLMAHTSCPGETTTASFASFTRGRRSANILIKCLRQTWLNMALVRGPVRSF